MTYTIQELAKLAGISSRTLRHYDQIGLLRANRGENGYRVYEVWQVDRLQQILFYRRLGMKLEKIGCLLDSPDYAPALELEIYLRQLQREQAQLAALIENVEKTIQMWKGEYQMTDQEKFDGLAYVQVNEKRYGQELRQRYGDAVMDAANKKFCAMDVNAWQAQKQLEQKIKTLLEDAMVDGNAAGTAAQAACGLHEQWLRLLWPEGVYSSQAHRALGQMYTMDKRFAAYYDAIAPGCAQFFCQALEVYCRK